MEYVCELSFLEYYVPLNLFVKRGIAEAQTNLSYRLGHATIRRTRLRKEKSKIGNAG